MKMNALKSLTLISIIFCTSFLYGQNKDIYLGLEIGPGFSSLRGNEIVEKTEFVPVFSGGIAFQYSFTRFVSLRTNIFFERKGEKGTAEMADVRGYSLGEFSYRSNFDYLTIPLLARFSFGEDVQFFLNAGPYIGYLLNHKFIRELKGENSKTELDLTDNYKRFDFGLSTGLGVNFPIHDKLLLSAEIRNNLGLMDLSTFPVFNGGSIKTNSTSLLIGVAYRLRN